jgi:hypothetical protein
MLNQILVLSPDGPCYVFRNYNGTSSNVDPQLISAMVALKSSGKIKLADVTNILNHETDNRYHYTMEISRTHNYISCAVSSNHSDSHKIREILPKINQMIYETLGNPNRISSIEKKKIEKMEHRIDLIMINEGLLNG